MKALDALARHNIRYADARFIRTEYNGFAMFDGDLQFNSYGGAEGIGVRVLYGDGWGFAAGSLESATETAKKALATAQVSNRLNRRFGNHINLEPVRRKALSDHSHRPRVIIDPFALDRDRIVGTIVATDKAMTAPHVQNKDIYLEFTKVHKEYANTEEFHTVQDFQFVEGHLSASGEHDGQIFQRSYEGFCLTAQGGFERVIDWQFEQNATRIASELRELMLAPACPTGVMDIVLHPSQLYLQTHENGHGFELDRMLHYEIGFAGGSFLQPKHAGRLQYGSSKVNLVANATYPQAAGTFAWDDDGVPAQKFYLVKDGVVQNFLGSRQTVLESTLPKHLRHSTGAMRAEDAEHTPLIRMTNIYLLPGNDGTIDDIVSNTENGLLLRTNRSWSIDNIRRNFHFGTEVGWRIRDGKIAGMVRSPNYQGETVSFWNSCDMVGSDLTLLGVGNCGKGQPGQSMYCGHPSPAARFKNVRVGIIGAENVGASAGGAAGASCGAPKRDMRRMSGRLMHRRGML